MSVAVTVFKDKRLTVVGLGLFGGGVGAALYLVGQGARVTVTDLKAKADLQDSVAALKGLPVTLHLGGHLEADFAGADAVIVGPAVRPDSRYLKIARAHGVPVIPRDNLFFEACPAQVIGVTGSNGKTTTTSLIGEILKQSDPRTIISGNIGGSLFDALGQIQADTPVVVELSSFQLAGLREMSYSPHIAVVTNISPNHLDYHKSMGAYVHAKKGILAHQGRDDIAVLNWGDAELRAWAKECRGRVAFFSIEGPVDEGAYLDHETIMAQAPRARAQTVCRSTDLLLVGRHNVENALAATAAAVAYGAPVEAVARTLRTFRGVPHRLELVREVDGVAYYNDSIATTPESTIAALDSFRGDIILIAGGYDKGIGFGGLAERIVDRVKALLLIGATADRIEGSVRARMGETSRPACFRCRTLDEAVRRAKECAVAGDAVLLSPACASYDMFKNFVFRGDAFREIVGSL